MPGPSPRRQPAANDWLRYIRWLLIELSAGLLLGLAFFFSFQSACVGPTIDARILLEQVRSEINSRLRTGGRIDDIEASLDKNLTTWPGGERILDEFHVSVRHSSRGAAVWIEPRHFACCRPTYGPIPAGN